MKYTLALLFFTLPFLTHEAPVISMPIVGIGSPSLIDVWTLAKLMESEAGNQGTTGKIYVADVLKNRSKESGKSITEQAQSGFYLKKPYKPKTWLLAVKIANLPTVHAYTYFANLKTAKNRSFVRWAKTRQGETVYDHYFFTSKSKKNGKQRQKKDSY